MKAKIVEHTPKGLNLGKIKSKLFFRVKKIQYICNKNKRLIKHTRIGLKHQTSTNINNLALTFQRFPKHFILNNVNRFRGRL
jgi:hypothetical protein